MKPTQPSFTASKDCRYFTLLKNQDPLRDACFLCGERSVEDDDWGQPQRSKPVHWFARNPDGTLKLAVKFITADEVFAPLLGMGE